MQGNGLAPSAQVVGLQPQTEAEATASTRGATATALLQGVDSTTTYGPYLRLGGFWPDTREWRASVLVVAHSRVCTSPPMLQLTDMQAGGAQQDEVAGRKVDEWLGWSFWRFDLLMECGSTPRTFQYMINMPQGCQPTMVRGPHTVAVPSLQQSWRVGYWSCNGFHEPEKQQVTGGIQPLWRDIMAVHLKSPFHCMVGGGDQIYNDDVWECPAVKYWTDHGSHTTKLEAPFTHEMEAQVNAYYLTAYLRHWCQPVWRDALAVIPHVMVWDDHDIWDGWGSYPDYLQNCAVFQGMFSAARRAYLLFQQHSTLDTIRVDNGVWGHAGWNWLSQLGPNIALLVQDGRTERSVKQIVEPATYNMMRERLSALPSTVQHLVIVTTVPLTYPQIPLFERGLHCLSCGFVLGRNRVSTVSLVEKAGLAKSMISQFGTVDILDDVVDHWDAVPHRGERKALIHMLQEFSLHRGWRISFVAGDVHLAAVTKFCSRDYPEPRTDHRYMVELITSAIGNTPPGKKIVKALETFAKMQRFDGDTEEGVVKGVFGRKKLMPARNWLLQQQLPDGDLHFQFRVEVKGKPLVNTYDVRVPRLELPPGAVPPTPTAAKAVGLVPPEAAPMMQAGLPHMAMVHTTTTTTQAVPGQRIPVIAPEPAGVPAAV